MSRRIQDSTGRCGFFEAPYSAHVLSFSAFSILKMSIPPKLSLYDDRTEEACLVNFVYKTLLRKIGIYRFVCFTAYRQAADYARVSIQQRTQKYQMTKGRHRG
jgi:hypothetical protein